VTRIGEYAAGGMIPPLKERVGFAALGAPEAGGRPGVVHHLGHLVGDGVAEVGPEGSQDVAFS